MSSRVVREAPAPTRADELVPSRSIYRRWESSFGFWTSFLIECTRKEDRSSSAGYAGDLILTVRLESLLQNTLEEIWYHHLLGILEVPSWSDIIASRVLPESTLSTRCCHGFGELIGDPCHSPWDALRRPVPLWLPWRRIPGGDEKIFHLKDLLFLWKNLPELLSGTLDSGVGNETVPSDKCSPENMLLEFGGVNGRSSMTKGSNQDHLYFFLKNVNTRV